MQKDVALNVFGEPLIPCSFDPLTGFFRDGCCKTNEEDVGSHLVCAVVTREFLQFSLEKGNDLISLDPNINFRVWLRETNGVFALIAGLKPSMQIARPSLNWKVPISML